MPGVLAKISSLHSNIPSAERKVGEYMTKNPEKAGVMSISELAEKSGVSIASVSRLSKKLGYYNYKELRTDMAQELFPDNESINSVFQPITPQDSDDEIIKKVFQGNIKSLEDTLKILNQPVLIETAKLIAKTPKLVFFGIGSSAHIGADAALRFRLLDIQAECYSDPQDILVEALRMKKKEVAVGISDTGRSVIIIDGLKMATERGATTIGISNHLKSALAEVSNIFLCTAFVENPITITALCSRVAQVCLLDALYLLVTRYKKLPANADYNNRVVEQLLRLEE